MNLLIDVSSLTHKLAELGDCELYYEWANDEQVREGSFNTGKIDWATHKKWFENKVQDENSVLLLFYEGSEPCGQLRIDVVNQESELVGLIDFSIAKEFRGMGLGAYLLREGITYFARNNEDLILKGIVKQTNTASCKSFVNGGFRLNKSEIMDNCMCNIYLSR